MPWPNPAVTSPTLALAGWCPLSLAGAQTTQLLVEPPWRRAVLWDRVTLTCQGLGTTGVTTWYKDGQRWRQDGHNNLTVTKSGTYTCERPSSGLSPPVRVLDGEGGLGVPILAPAVTPGLWVAPLVLQVLMRALLEGDTVTLRCRH
uniref:Ig-like domain-containing protein n=1 Tax=Junco hyemalis TaxID=40217 RepID=A0A8C5J794_JUNHY